MIFCHTTERTYTCRIYTIICFFFLQTMVKKPSCNFCNILSQILEGKKGKATKNVNMILKFSTNSFYKFNKEKGIQYNFKSSHINRFTANSITSPQIIIYFLHTQLESNQHSLTHFVQHLLMPFVLLLAIKSTTADNLMKQL